VRTRWAAPLIVVALFGCGSEQSDEPLVDAADFEFAKRDITVKPGSTVTWTNTGSTAHTVKGDGFFSKAIEPGERYSFRFSSAGSFDYICTLHTDMEGSVKVE
jgi:plastocyanin